MTQTDPQNVPITERKANPQKQLPRNCPPRVSRLNTIGRVRQELLVFGTGPLPAPRDFAVELLTEPVFLTRPEPGTIRITINRNRVSEALYTTAAKRELCWELLGTPERVAGARQLDRDVHEFLLGRSHEPSMTAHLDTLPLRWASGGGCEKPDGQGTVHPERQQAIVHPCRPALSSAFACQLYGERTASCQSPQLYRTVTIGLNKKRTIPP